MWDPQRDFAFLKVPTSGVKSVGRSQSAVALGRQPGHVRRDSPDALVRFPLALDQGTLRKKSLSLGRNLAGSVGGLLPGAVSGMWDPQRRSPRLTRRPRSLSACSRSGHRTRRHRRRRCSPRPASGTLRKKSLSLGRNLAGSVGGLLPGAVSGMWDLAVSGRTGKTARARSPRLTRRPRSLSACSRSGHRTPSRSDATSLGRSADCCRGRSRGCGTRSEISPFSKP
jgi:hypothetical protein